MSGPAAWSHALTVAAGASCASPTTTRAAVGQVAPSSSSTGRRCTSAASVCFASPIVISGTATTPLSATDGSSSRNDFSRPVYDAL